MVEREREREREIGERDCGRKGRRESEKDEGGTHEERERGT